VKVRLERSKIKEKIPFNVEISRKIQLIVEEASSDKITYGKKRVN
jgi:hypothetical protein